MYICIFYFIVFIHKASKLATLSFIETWEMDPNGSIWLKIVYQSADIRIIIYKFSVAITFDIIIGVKIIVNPSLQFAASVNIHIKGRQSANMAFSIGQCCNETGAKIFQCINCTKLCNKILYGAKTRLIYRYQQAPGWILNVYWFGQKYAHF